MTVRKLEQTFDFEMAGRDITLTGDSNGPIGELAGKTITYIDDTKYAFKYVDGKTDVEIKKSIRFLLWLNIALLFVVMFVGNEIARRYKVAPYLIFIVLPILLTPLWLNSGLGWFRIAKLYSVLIGATMITLYRFNFGLKNHKWLAYVIIAFLGVNIFEACAQDWSQPDLPNKLSAIAGILNISTMLYLWSTMRIDTEKPHDMLWPAMTIGWIFVGLSLGSNVIYAFLHFRYRITKKAPKKLDVGQHASVAE